MSKEFPKTGIPEENIRSELLKIRKSMKPYSENAFRVYSTNPDPLAIEAISYFLPFNKNNIGTHTRTGKTMGALADLEKEVILMIGNLMGAKENEIDGYITQGGTEGNITGLWIGRNMLRINNSKLCLLKTTLTHYSVEKAADLLNIEKVVDIPCNAEYGMDSVKLEKKIKSLSQEGYQNFLIALTLGYNTTGTVDPVDEIDSVIKRLEKDLKIKTYVHLDAAIGGLIYPFISEKKFDFNNHSLNSLSTALYKTGFTPRNSGVFLCRKNLQKYIERFISYLPYKRDDTLSSSRSSNEAASCWSIIHFLGKEGFRRHILHCLDLKKYFIYLLEEKKLPIKYISDPFMPILAFTLKDKMLPLYLEKKHHIEPIPLLLDEREEYHYTIIFMPHITKKSLSEFITELTEIYKN